jgi:hypothetical protein
MTTDYLKEQYSDNLQFEDLVNGLVNHFKDLWWSGKSTIPDLGPVYSPNEKKACETKLVNYLDQLGEELKWISRDRPDRLAIQERLLPSAGNFLMATFGLEYRHVNALTSYGFAEAVEEFVLRARHFDKDISPGDIYQASRNAWSMNLLQFLMGLPVEVTPAVLAYNLLYPYSDNYLDNPSIPSSVKTAFSHHFELRLEGIPVTPANSWEQKIFDLVGMIEDQFDRQLHPEVYASLMAIFRAQTKSIRLQLPDASRYEVDVLGLDFEKGGTSVLADAYLVAGSLTPFQKEFSFYYGAFTQLMDDLEDVEQDYQDGIMTVFSQAVNHEPLDSITNRTIVFGNGLLDAMSRFHISGLETLEEIMRKCITPLMIDSAGRVGHLYSHSYLSELERHSPYRFTQLKRLRRKFSPHFSAEQIIEMIILANGNELV